jgi:hypothetical protein
MKEPANPACMRPVHIIGSTCAGSAAARSYLLRTGACCLSLYRSL